jgi:hypothetical protein
MSAQKLGKLVDGIFAASCTCIEPIGVPQCREFYRARGQKLFIVALQAHERLDRRVLDRRAVRWAN